MQNVSKFMQDSGNHWICRENQVKNSILLFIARNWRPGLSFFSRPSDLQPEDSKKSKYSQEWEERGTMITD